MFGRTRRRRAVDLGELLGGGRKGDARGKTLWVGLDWRRSRRRGDVVRLAGGVEPIHRRLLVASVVDSVIDGAVPRLHVVDDLLSRINRWYVGVLGLTCGLSRKTLWSGVKKRRGIGQLYTAAGSLRSAWPSVQAREKKLGFL